MEKKEVWGESLERKGAGMSRAHPPKYRRRYRLPVQDRPPTPPPPSLTPHPRFSKCQHPRWQAASPRVKPGGSGSRVLPLQKQSVSLSSP